eukprot:1154560-Pelagomonas_calceolata.AAC.13
MAAQAACMHRCANCCWRLCFAVVLAPDPVRDNNKLAKRNSRAAWTASMHRCARCCWRLCCCPCSQPSGEQQQDCQMKKHSGMGSLHLPLCQLLLAPPLLSLPQVAASMASTVSLWPTRLVVHDRLPISNSLHGAAKHMGSDD